MIYDFKPKEILMYKRFLFNSATQNSDREEGIDEFVSRLRKMTSSCKYEMLIDEVT